MKAIRTLSNYIMFLLVLVDRPYMLPGLAHSMLYRQTSDNLADMWDCSPNHQKGAVITKLKDFFSLDDDHISAGSQHIEKIANFLFEEKPKATHSAPRLNFSYSVAKELHGRMGENGGRTVMLQLLLRVDGFSCVCGQ